MEAQPEEPARKRSRLEDRTPRASPSVIVSTLNLLASDSNPWQFRPPDAQIARFPGGAAAFDAAFYTNALAVAERLWSPAAVADAAAAAAAAGRLPAATRRRLGAAVRGLRAWGWPLADPDL